MRTFTDAHGHTSDEVCRTLGVDPSRGLDAKIALLRLQEYGENRLKKQKEKTALQIFLEQFLDPVIYVLSAASLLGFIFGEIVEGIAVLVVILITTIIGFLMEWKALKSINALLEMVESESSVMRDGSEVIIDDHQIISGDIILLSAGDVVPCDARIIEHEGFAVKESMLTGESKQVNKSLESLPIPTMLHDRINMVFAGTLVTRGAAKVVCTATGDYTELGKITSLSRESEKEITPLEKKLKKLSKQLIWLTIFLAILILLVGILQGRSIVQMVETAFALAVAAIPEGLPIVATIALVRGMLRLAKDRAIIRNLGAVEALGNVSTICTDKTGTLTENVMTVHTVILNDTKLVMPKEGDVSYWADRKEQEGFRRLIEVGILCSNVKYDLDHEDFVGDPIEIAVFRLCEKAEIDTKQIQEQNPEIVELPFDTSIKMMATVNQLNEGYRVNVKGALENLLNHCNSVLDNGKILRLTNKDKWTAEMNKLASQGYRILAFAGKDVDHVPDNDQMLEDLTLIGIVAFRDPPRKDVRAAIETCHKAGIEVVMVTGDHAGTGLHIAQAVGLINEQNQDQVLHGKDVPGSADISPGELEKLLKTKVFARVTPAQKLNLVQFYQKHNHIVGMTGDGVNDAPALKKADIGIAMGIRGTEAAKEVSDLILRDDQFSSIGLAIKEGRIIFENIRKFVTFLLSCNFAEIISVAIASLGGLPLPLLPMQILYLNLVTDIFPALALAMGEGEQDIMDQKPRKSDEPILTKSLWKSTIIYGFGITASVIGVSIFAHFYLKLDGIQVNNMAFYTLVFCQLLNVFNLPKSNESFINNSVTRNLWIWGSLILSSLLTLAGLWITPLGNVLNLVDLELAHFGWIILFSIGSLVLTQIVKRSGGTA
ncbi:MAG: cation-transporting P-type ATPase [Bacteroidia bacterium]|nr:cation-transporting P-type ATPase [Bacteroidia bacterium]